jgi:anaerobic selenocysteine-containing dehydrogenase
MCSNACGVRVAIDDGGRVAGVRADPDQPLTAGFACFKGLRAAEAHNDPGRLLRPLRRRSDGGFEPIPLAQALDEIAARLKAIVGHDGPNAVATFRGTANYFNAAASALLRSWHGALGSDTYYSTMTIDQSAKWVAIERLGRWDAGPHLFEESDVWLFAGHNPIVSMMGGAGFHVRNPTLQLKQAKARGTRIIVVDPRRTETARYADIHLQLLPGEDATLFAGLLRIVLTEGWIDRPFCTRHVDGLGHLAAAVEPFTPSYVAQRAGVPAALLHQAAALFARDSRRGAAVTGTGPNMVRHSNLAEHLVQCLNVVCGRFQRAGETGGPPHVVDPPRARRAEVLAPRRGFERAPPGRVRGASAIFGERMSGALANEILTPGPGQIKGLIVAGGNPANSLPDHRKAIAALASLELLVAIEPAMTATARLAHYVLPPVLQYERADIPEPQLQRIYMGVPFTQYAPAIARPPPGHDLVEEWYVFWALARRLGRALTIGGQKLDMDVAPTTDDVLRLVMGRSRVSLDALKAIPGGRIFDGARETVQPARAGATARFAVMPADVAQELCAVLDDDDGGNGFTHRLAVRRMRDVVNTSFHRLPSIRQRHAHNPAYLNPADLAALGITRGDRLAIASDAGSIVAIAETDDTVRPGVISMSHGWGGLSGADGGVSTNLLTTTDRFVESINAMPRLTGIPVKISRARDDDRSQGEQSPRTGQGTQMP